MAEVDQLTLQRKQRAEYEESDCLAPRDNSVRWLPHTLLLGACECQHGMGLGSV